MNFCSQIAKNCVQCPGIAAINVGWLGVSGYAAVKGILMTRAAGSTLGVVGGVVLATFGTACFLRAGICVTMFCQTQAEGREKLKKITCWQYFKEATYAVLVTNVVSRTTINALYRKKMHEETVA